ncbi:hypothetical protein Pmar_PMAR029288 [Perkinsus marinus ATCC 50983]|uniref:Uncharacterized protein n=1 Tax=Perkinsus marinus (strain ATCC 50983 / TXsc) TaxID=423536 RepID=C5KMR4_PERM5|nr:hypothetical protein Pmar_PMAR029288 [Perkinsus marinus ATCC 50983]EER14222.1 hypothetical protein Pmar_PMAR029288 [Perkinsus marinus ATCC 50983]|eukprot:XP_002782427.1 hypothetical protein Pmar_PMAR029288 [Perkinsus marinus ATCC 50983]
MSPPTKSGRSLKEGLVSSEASGDTGAPGKPSEGAAVADQSGEAPSVSGEPSQEAAGAAELTKPRQTRSSSRSFKVRKEKPSEGSAETGHKTGGEKAPNLPCHPDDGSQRKSLLERQFDDMRSDDDIEDNESNDESNENVSGNNEDNNENDDDDEIVDEGVVSGDAIDPNRPSRTESASEKLFMKAIGTGLVKLINKAASDKSSSGDKWHWPTLRKRLEKVDMDSMDRSLIRQCALAEVDKDPSALFNKDIWFFAAVGDDRSFGGFIQALMSWLWVALLQGAAFGDVYSHVMHCISAAGFKSLLTGRNAGTVVAIQYDEQMRKDAGCAMAMSSLSVKEACSSLSRLDSNRLILLIGKTADNHNKSSYNNKSSYHNSRGGPYRYAGKKRLFNDEGEELWKKVDGKWVKVQGSSASGSKKAKSGDETVAVGTEIDSVACLALQDLIRLQTSDDQGSNKSLYFVPKVSKIGSGVQPRALRDEGMQDALKELSPPEHIAASLSCQHPLTQAPGLPASIVASVSCHKRLLECGPEGLIRDRHRVMEYWNDQARLSSKFEPSDDIVGALTAPLNLGLFERMLKASNYPDYTLPRELAGGLELTGEFNVHNDVFRARPIKPKVNSKKSKKVTVMSATELLSGGVEKAYDLADSIKARKYGLAMILKGLE